MSEPHLFDDTSDDLVRAAQDDAAGLDAWYDADAWAEDPEMWGPNSRLIRSVHGRSTELWLRSASKYQTVLADLPHDKFVFSTNEIRHRSIRPFTILSKVLPQPLDFTWMEVGRQYAEVFTRSTYETGESLRWPVWTYGDDPRLLLRFCRAYSRRGWDRIVVAYLPRTNLPEMRRVLEWVHRVAAAYPHVKLHYSHGTAYSQIFGLNFYSSDLTPSAQASYNRIVLPNGRVVGCREDVRRNLKWVHVLGFSAKDVDNYEGRVMFNMASAIWAAEHWNDPEALAPVVGRTRIDPYGLLLETNAIAKRGPGGPGVKRLTSVLAKPPFDPDLFAQSTPDSTEPYHLAEPIIGGPLIPVNPRGGPQRDKIACNSCTLIDTCRFYREGAICGLPSSEIAKLAEVFGTRDADAVRDALTAVVRNQAERYERSVNTFNADEESDIRDLDRSKHLLAMEGSLVKSMETLIKVLDPSYRPNSLMPSVQASVTHVYNPQVLVANVLKELSDRGIDRSQITPALLESLLPPELPEK